MGFPHERFDGAWRDPVHDANAERPNDLLAGMGVSELADRASDSDLRADAEADPLAHAIPANELDREPELQERPLSDAARSAVRVWASHLIRGAAWAHGVGPVYEIAHWTAAATGLFRAADSLDGTEASIPVDFAGVRLAIGIRPGREGRGMRLTAVPAPTGEPFAELAELRAWNGPDGPLAGAPEAGQSDEPAAPGTRAPAAAAAFRVRSDIRPL